jgi:hypothetical protein
VIGEADQVVGVDVVEVERSSRHRCVEAQKVVLTQEMACLLGGTSALGTHQDVNSVRGPHEPASTIEQSAMARYVSWDGRNIFTRNMLR